MDQELKEYLDARFDDVEARLIVSNPEPRLKRLEDAEGRVWRALEILSQKQTELAQKQTEFIAAGQETNRRIDKLVSAIGAYIRVTEERKEGKQ